MERLTRRGILVGAAASGLALAWARRPAGAAQLMPTPAQTAGPYYPSHVDLGDYGSDLLGSLPRSANAPGEVLDLTGRVLDQAGHALPGAIVEIWQADAFGRYNHPRDEARGPRDESFTGFGHAVAGADGFYAFRTIKPAAYPPGGNWRRTPHVHFRVLAPRTQPLVTQMYFAGEPLNADDGVLRGISDEAQRARIVVPVEPMPSGDLAVRFDIVMSASVAG